MASFRTAALREYKPLAEQGVALAQFFLGLMYEEGLGVAQDAAQAAVWYRKVSESMHKVEHLMAALQGQSSSLPLDDDDAKEEARRHRWRKDAEQSLAEVQRLAREWTEKNTK